MQNEKKIVFAVSTDKSTVLLGFTEKAWEWMKGGMTHNLDLNGIGVPLKLVAWGGKTRKDVLRPLGVVGKLQDVDLERNAMPLVMPPVNRDAIGKAVRDCWVMRQKQKHPDRNFPTWEELTEFERETDRLIAEAVVKALPQA